MHGGAVAGSGGEQALSATAGFGVPADSAAHTAAAAGGRFSADCGAANSTVRCRRYFAGWLAYQDARLSMMALLYGKLMVCMVELSRLPSR